MVFSGFHLFSVVFIGSQWFLVILCGSQFFSLVHIGFQWFLLTIRGYVVSNSDFFEVVLNDFERFSAILIGL